MKHSILFLVLLSTASLADDIPWYTVEILIFHRTVTTAEETELWPYDPGFPDLANALRLNEPSPGLATQRRLDLGWKSELEQAGAVQAPTNPPNPYELLGEEQLTLVDARNMMKRSAVYEPLLHVAWRQLGLDNEQSRPVHIQSSPYPLPLPQVKPAFTDQRQETALPGESGPEQPASELEPVASFVQPASDLLAVEPSVEGTIRLYRGRYLHFNADLVYFRPRPESTSEEVFLDEEVYLTEPEVIPTHFRLIESRRMRSNELHYLDHPLFGLLIRVTPYELPLPEEEGRNDNPGTAAGDGAKTRRVSR